MSIRVWAYALELDLLNGLCLPKDGTIHQLKAIKPKGKCNVLNLAESTRCTDFINLQLQQILYKNVIQTKEN